MINLNIPMHISLHPGWLQDKEEFFNDIRYFFESKGVNIHDYTNSGNFFDILID